MIIYDENLKISAITQDSLELLGFDSLDDFLLRYKDISELVITSQESTNYSFLEFLQNTKDNSARVNLKRKDGGAILLEARLQNAILKNGKKFFIVLLEKQDIINNQNLIAAVKVKPTLRLPVFKLNAWYLFDTQTQSLIDDSWFETSLKILNLSKKDFVSYLNIFLRNAREILIQSAIIAKDEIMLKKYVDEIREAALNLKLNNLADELNAFLDNNQNGKMKEMSLFTKRLIEIENIVKKYSKKSIHEK